MNEFQGKVAIVTGGTSGIGRAAAVAYAREGARVVVAGRRAAEGGRTVRAPPGPGWRGIFRADRRVEGGPGQGACRTDVAKVRPARLRLQQCRDRARAD